MGGRLAGSVIAAALLALPVTAGATWEPAVKLTEANAVEPSLGVFPNGEAIVVWGPRAVSSAEAGSDGIEAAHRPPDGSFGSPVMISPPASNLPQLAVNSSGGAAARWYSTDGFQLAPWTGGATFGPPDGTDNAEAGPIAIDEAGNVSVLIHEGSWEANHDARLAVVTRAADGSWGPVREVARQASIDGPGIAVDGDGTRTVAWRGPVTDGPDAPERTYVARAAPGRPFDPPQEISGPYDSNNSGGPVELATNARGDVLVVWPVLEGPNPYAPDPDYRVANGLQAAFRPAGGGFGPVERIAIESECMRPVGSQDLAVGPDGESLLTWSNGIGVSLAERPVGGPFKPPRFADPFHCGLGMSPPFQTSPSAAISADGSAMLAWASQRGDPRRPRLEVVRRPASGEFRPPEVVHVGPATNFYDVDLGMDANGAAVVVWSPQTRGLRTPGNRDLGIYATLDDGQAPAGISGLDLEADAKPAFTFNASRPGRVRVIVKRRTRRRSRTVLVLRARVVRGVNDVPLPAAATRKLSRPGKYVAIVRAIRRNGKPMKPRRIRFQPLDA